MPDSQDVHDEAERLITQLGHHTVLRVLCAAQDTANLIAHCIDDGDASAWKDASGKFCRLQPLLDHKETQ